MSIQSKVEDDRRVVISGMGILTVIGDDLDTYFDGLVAGRSGITRWKRIQDPGCYSKIGGDLSDFDLDAHFRRVGPAYPPGMMKRCRSLLRAAPLPTRLGAAAALQAYTDAQLPAGLNPERMGHVLAGHNLNAGYIVENVHTYQTEPDYIEPLFALLHMDTDVLSVTSELLTLKGPTFTVGAACAGGNLAVQAAVDLLRAGRVDAVVVTGGCHDLDAVSLHGYALQEAITFQSFNEEPTRASRPFDALREGFVPSHGSGAVVLETLAGARKRGAKIYAEILGVSSASDASRLAKPNREGQVRAIGTALQEGGVTPDQVDYVNAHATSTPLGDRVEVAAIKSVLGERAYEVPVNSTKSMIGHCLSAAGVVELIATVLQMQHGIVHPTINQEQPDWELDLDFVPNQAREHRIDVAVSNSFGVGGLNSCVVVGRWE